MDEINLKFSANEIVQYLHKYGRRGQRVLSDLGKLIPFIEAVYNSEVGKEILTDDINRLSELYEKVINLDANEEEKAEYRYLRNHRLPRVTRRLQEFIVKSKELKENVAPDRN